MTCRASGILLVVCLLSACGAKPSRPEAGTLEDGVYSNPYFGLSLKTPPGWSVENAPQGLDRWLDQYLAVLTIREGVSEKGRVHSLLRTSSVPIALAGPNDAAAALGVAFVGDKPGFDGFRAVTIARDLLKLPSSPARIEKDFSEAILGGFHFASARFEVKLKGGGSVHEDIYVKVHRDHVIVLGVESKTVDGLKTAAPLLASVRFGAPS